MVKIVYLPITLPTYTYISKEHLQNVCVVQLCQQYQILVMETHSIKIGGPAKPMTVQFEVASLIMSQVGLHSTQRHIHLPYINIYR